jgi:hypothetical protein
MSKAVDIIVEFINRILTVIWEAAVAAMLSASPVGKFVEKKRLLIESIDPKRFEPKQAASLIGIPAFVSTFLCELAVRQGRFTRLTPKDAEVTLYSLTTTEAK